MFVGGEHVTYEMDHWRICDCVERVKTEKLLEASKITWAFQKKTFDNFHLENVHDCVHEAYRKARIYTSKFDVIKNTANNGIIIMGRPGSGKTHLMMATSNELMRKGVELLYFPYVEGMEEVKEDMKKEDVNKKRFEKMQQVPVLFIDDLFKPPKEPSAYELTKMYEVINYRYMEKKPIIISTERYIEDLIRFDEALGSRIKEMCQDFRVEMRGDSNLNYRMRDEAI
jgi:DNA replication protein DnaC